MTYSKNEHAEKLLGLRHCTDVIFLLFPCELGYHCPVCEYDLLIDGVYDERLEWSEYNCFIWCRVCNKDYPSCFCLPHDIDSAIKVFLHSVESVLK